METRELLSLRVEVRALRLLTERMVLGLPVHYNLDFDAALLERKAFAAGGELKVADMPDHARPRFLFLVADLIGAGSLDEAGPGRWRLTPPRSRALAQAQAGEEAAARSRLQAQVASKRRFAIEDSNPDERALVRGGEAAVVAAARALAIPLRVFVVDYQVLGREGGKLAMRCNWCGAEAIIGQGNDVAPRIAFEHGAGCVVLVDLDGVLA